MSGSGLGPDPIESVDPDPDSKSEERQNGPQRGNILALSSEKLFRVSRVSRLLLELERTSSRSRKIYIAIIIQHIPISFQLHFPAIFCIKNLGFHGMMKTTQNPLGFADCKEIMELSTQKSIFL
jgi:hypothetical protein